MILDKTIIDNWLKDMPLMDTSKETYRAEVIPLVGGELTPETVRTHLIKGNTGEKYGKCYARRSAVKSLLYWLSIKKLIDFSLYEPFFDLKNPFRIKYSLFDREHDETLTYDEVKAVIEAVKSYELKLILMVLFDSGARVRGVLKLKKGDISVFGSDYRVNLTEKGKKKVTKSITEEIYHPLVTFMTKSRFKYPFLASNVCSSKTFNWVYQKYWIELKNMSRPLMGGVGVSFHWFRRAAGIYWYNKLGNDLIAVKEFLGHKDISTTSRYLRAQGQKVAIAMRKEHHW